MPSAFLCPLLVPSALRAPAPVNLSVRLSSDNRHNHSLGLMREYLRLFFERDPDGTGELFAEVAMESFSGVSSAWFGERELSEFANELIHRFPLPQSAVELKGGFWSKNGATIEQLHVGIAFYPIGSTGLIGCHVQLAKPLHRDDRPQQQSMVAVELETSYEQLRLFGQELLALAHGECQEATLGKEKNA